MAFPMLRRRSLLVGLASAAVVLSTGSFAMTAGEKNSPDIAALSALRPGMPAEALEAAMGSAWRPIAPHKGGIADILENSHGFTARIDRHGRIGDLTFDHRFAHAVDGIAMGMKPAAAREAMPALEIGEDLPMMRGVRFGTRRFPEGYVMRVMFTLETVNEISISNPAADYQERTPPPYPAATGTPGAPFADPNLKLTVLSALLDAKLIDLGTPEQLASHVLGRPVDLEEDGYDLIPEARDYLYRYPLTDELLAAVDNLEFDGGSSIYPFAWYFWSGEEVAFDISSLEGIELCPNLRTFSAISMLGTVDLRVLLPLRKLETVSLSTGASHLEALLELPALKKVRVLDDPLYEQVTTPGTPARDVFETLKARGVKVWVNWMTAYEPAPPAFQ